MDFTETEVFEVRLWYGKCTNDINTDHLFFVSLKTTKKQKEKKKLKNQPTPGVDHGSLEQ